MRHLLLVSIATLALAFGGCDDIGQTEQDATEVLGEGNPTALSVLAMVNDPATDLSVLKGAKLTTPTAGRVLSHRDGADGEKDLFDNVAELDAVKGIGPASLKNLAKRAEQLGYLEAELRKETSVIFSPQPAELSHNVEVARIIGEAQHNIDIAMYSFSDAGISAALADATARGVKVRMLFETASDDRKLTGTALSNSKSGKLEKIGVDVRWVNKIMHHKLMIVDGPRDDLALAQTAIVVSGSGNWSSGAATKYDENTLFLTAQPELNLKLQREFNLLWEHSRALDENPALGFELSTAVIEEADIKDNPGLDIFLTSDNFKVDGDIFSVTQSSRVSDELVRAINEAKTRILVASGHLRSRPVAEALMAKRAADPTIEIRVYLDGQEYISESGHNAQQATRDNCLAAATTPSKQQACLDRSFLYGLEIERAGIDVRYKGYAYRWDVSYAKQMHNKVLLIDDALYSGSYNLSDNAEHNTFENMMMLRGPEFRDLRSQYAEKFEFLWTEGAGKLEGLRQTIDTQTTIPIVFEPMSLSWQEFRDLKSLISAECPAVNSSAFRLNAASHQTCTK